MRDGGVPARTRILERLRDALATRDPIAHPGPFRGERPAPPPSPIEGFIAMFEAAGGEVVILADEGAAGDWLSALDGVGSGPSGRPASVALGSGVPTTFLPGLPRVDAAGAELAISRAGAAIAETGTLVLDARDGRRSQLLAPTHAILVAAADVRSTLADALEAAEPDLPSALGLHSGPSKSADIGQVMVRGVHGPGRVFALVVGDVGR